MITRRYLQLFGPVRVESVAGDVPRFRSQRTMALLGYLVAERRSVSRDALAALFWPDESQSKGRSNLRRELHNLNQILPDCWEIDRQSVQFASADHTAVDLYRFLEFEQTEQWAEAAELVRGAFLEGLYLDDNLEFEIWLMGERERWRQRAEAVLTCVVEWHTRQATYPAALDSARKLLQLTPWNEAIHRQVMWLLACTGQRAAALRQYQMCLEILDSELGVPPDAETTALFEAIRAGQEVIIPSVLSTPLLSRHNLPAQTTPFIGREDELTDLSRLLHDPAARLITIFAPGGMGKTRLALAAAQQYLEASQDRVYFVDLAPLPSEENIVPAIAEAAGYPFQGDARTPEQQLLDYLREKQMLLVLDNFEHLLAQVGLVYKMLQAAPQVNVLITSRERLQLSGETIFALDGMAFPDWETASPNGEGSPNSRVEDALNYTAIKLFMQSARRVRSDFALGVDDLADVARICRLVGGMPLGILLAAAWVDLLSPKEIADEIGRSLDFLATEWHDIPDRQRNIRAVFEHSWDRLNEAERQVFMKLSVFRGGFTRAAAQVVTEASLKLLSTLVNKSLLQGQRSGRYTLHELLRQYAEAKLEAAGQTEGVRDDHSAYYSNFLHEREADLKGRRQLAALDEIEVEFENVRASWRWAVQRKRYATIAQALESLIWFCYMRSRTQESRELLRLGREQLAPASGEQPHPVWGRILVGPPDPMLSYLESPLEIRTRIETGLAIVREHDNQANIAFCLWRFGAHAYGEDNLEEALAYFEQSLVYYRSLADHFYLSYLLKDMALLYLRLDQPDQGMPLLQQSVALRRKLGKQTGLADSLGALGWVAYNGAHYVEAEAYWQESAQLSRQIGDRRLVAWNLMSCGWLALFSRGDLAIVRALAEEAQTVALDIDDQEGKDRAQALFGFLAGMTEDYFTCRQAFPPAANRHKFPYNRAWELIGLCLAACGLGDDQTARQHLQELLELSHSHGWLANYAIALPFAAVLAARAEEPEHAVELLSLAFHHRLSPKGWLNQWPLLARLRTELEIKLGPDAFKSAWLQGKSLDLETTAETLLA